MFRITERMRQTSTSSREQINYTVISTWTSMRTANFDLMPADAPRLELERMFDAYARMQDILDGVEVVRRTDTFGLRRAAYDKIRDTTGLLARLITNGIREYAAGIRRLRSANRPGRNPVRHVRDFARGSLPLNAI